MTSGLKIGDWVEHPTLGSGQVKGLEGDKARIFFLDSGCQRTILVSVCPLEPQAPQNLRGVLRILCLANSRKLSGRCVAGRKFGEQGTGAWIRPVSSKETGEVSEYERQYEDGSDPQVLDIIDVPVVRPQPAGYQSENWLLDGRYYWRKAGRLSSSDLPRMTDSVEPLWVDDCHTYHGQNDKVPIQLLRTCGTSLRLICVDALTLAVFAPGEAFGNAKRRVQGQFVHAGQRYSLWITDPRCERKYLARSDGRYQLGRCCLTISLGERYKDACYKLIAAVIEVG